jgi:hypothetical protein
MTLVRRRPNRLPAVALVAALAVGLSATWGSAQTRPSEPDGSWQLRARVKVAPGASPSGPRMLPRRSPWSTRPPAATVGTCSATDLPAGPGSS